MRKIVIFAIALILLAQAALANTVCDFDDYQIGQDLMLEDFKVVIDGEGIIGDWMDISYSLRSLQDTINIFSHSVRIDVDYDRVNEADLEYQHDLLVNSAQSLELDQAIIFEDHFVINSPGTWEIFPGWDLGTEIVYSEEKCIIEVPDDTPQVDVYINPASPVFGQTIEIVGDTVRTYDYMKIFVNDIRIAKCEQLEGPCKVEYKLEEEGDYEIEAKIVVEYNAENETFNSDKIEFSVAGEGIPPILDVDLSPAQPRLGDEVQLYVSAIDDSPVSSIDIYINDIYAKTCNARSCSFVTDQTGTGFKYKVVATDYYGNVAEEQDTLILKPKDGIIEQTPEDIESEATQTIEGLEVDVINKNLIVEPITETETQEEIQGQIEIQAKTKNLTLAMIVLAFVIICMIVAMLSVVFLKPKD